MEPDNEQAILQELRALRAEMKAMHLKLRVLLYLAGIPGGILLGGYLGIPVVTSLIIVFGLCFFHQYFFLKSPSLSS